MMGLSKEMGKRKIEIKQIITSNEGRTLHTNSAYLVYCYFSVVQRARAFFHLC